MGLLSFAEDTEPSFLDEKMKWKENSAPKDSPKPEKPKEKSKAADKEDGLYSLSFDQVNDNADELIELRGEGRYFGVTDPETGATINAQQSLGPLCDNCHRRGHIRSKCKTVVCHKCGVVGDHYETQCPTTMICSRCGQRGHLASACTSKTRKRQYCKHCDTFNHGDFNCPSIWRSYITRVNKDEEYVLPVMYCYNCGDDTHFGDECPRQRSSRVPNMNGSAFSGTNLPKHLRSVYFDSFHKKSSNGYNGRANDAPQANKRRNFESGHSYQKQNYDSGNSYKSQNFGPSRSGYIASNTSKKKPQLPSKPAQANRSGYLPNRKPPAKPNRSGVIQKGKKRGGNMQSLY